LANFIANSDFPEAVGPKITINFIYPTPGVG